MIRTHFLLASATLFSFSVGECALLHGQILEATDASLAQAGGGVQYAVPSDSGTPDESSDVSRVSWPSLTLPKITMPTITLPKFSMPKLPAFWPSSDRSDDASPALLAPVAVGARKVSAGTKKAWEGAKEMFSFGSGEQAVPERRDTESKPSILQRLFTPTPKPTGPRTIGEFMSQRRLDP